MKRAFTSDAVVTAPDYSDLVSDGYATAGNPQLGVPATLPGAAWFNLTQEEIVRVIEAMGLTPANAPQLLAALIAGRFPLGPHYAYDADTDYPVNAIALYSNKLYICLTANGPGSTVVTPGTDSSVWNQIPSLADIVSNLSIFDLCPDGAAQHNALYRGKDITDKYDDGSLFTAIADATFKDIFPGDYFTKSITIDGTTYSDVNWIVGDLDYLLNYYTLNGEGDTYAPLSTHHICVFPDVPLGSQYMNSSNDTAGGYLGSYMYLTHLPKVRTGFNNLFGSHLLPFWQYLSNTVNKTATSRAGSNYVGTVTACAWTKCTVELMNENMVYGVKAGGSFRDAYDNPHILAAFQHSARLRFNGLEDGSPFTWWLRDVVSSAHFAIAHSHGTASGYSASTVVGVRPFCLIK